MEDIKAVFNYYGILGEEAEKLELNYVIFDSFFKVS